MAIQSLDGRLAHSKGAGLREHKARMHARAAWLRADITAVVLVPELPALERVCVFGPVSALHTPSDSLRAIFF